MSVNVMSIEEINEVSGALTAPDWVSDAGTWGALGALVGAPFGAVAIPYVAGGFAAFSIGWDIGTWLSSEFYWTNRQWF